MIRSSAILVRACVILSLCVVSAKMGPAPAPVPSTTAAAAVAASTSTDGSIVVAPAPNPYAGLPTKFGDEDDVIRLKHARPAIAAVMQQKPAAKAVGGKAARKSPLDELSVEPAKGTAADDDEDDDYYDDEDDDAEDHGDDDFDVAEHVDHHGKDTGRSEYTDETDADADGDELGPTLDNFGASLDSGANDEALPIFLAEPQSAYIVRGRPAQLKCRAAHALQLTFKCSGSSVSPPSTLDSHVDPHTGVPMLEVTATITKTMVYEYFSKEAYKCRCHAWSPRAKVKSQPATIEIAYIGKQFSLQPQPVRVEVGGRTEIRCGAPSGLPLPTVQWLKNGQQLSLVSDSASSSAALTSDGNVLIAHATMNDMANYTCVAENLAGKRHALPVVASVYVNGNWDAWGPWMECRCPGRSPEGQKRTRTCTNPSPVNGGASCSGFGVQRTSDCLQCSGGRWSGWSEWSTCTTECIQVRRRSCIGVNFDSTSSPAGTKWLTAIIDNSGGGGGGGNGGDDSADGGAASAHANHPDKTTAACAGRDIQTAECSGGACRYGIGAATDGVKWSMIAGLAILGIVCLALGALLARSARKGFRYGFGRRTGPPPTYVCGSTAAEHKAMQFQPGAGGPGGVNQCNITSNYEYPSLHYHSLATSSGGSGSGGSGNGGGCHGVGGGGGGGSVISQKTGRPMSEHHYDVPQMNSDNFRPLVGLGSCSSNSYCPSNYSRRTASPSSTATTVNTYGNEYA